MLFTASPRFLSFRHRRVQPVDDVALLHLPHVEEDVLAHLDVLAEGQVGYEQPPAGALGALDGKALRRGVLPQLVGGLLQAGEVQRALQLRQLRFAVDVDQVIFVLEPVDAQWVLLLFCLRFLLSLLPPGALCLPVERCRPLHLCRPAA